MVTVSLLKEASEEGLADLNRLMDQLRADNQRQGILKELKQIIADPNIALAVAQDGKKIVGAASLYIIQKIGKSTGYIEDVVVDEAYRGRGLGTKLMTTLIEVAREKELLSISLTSRPARVAGNKLYQKMGFEQKETNVYRLKLG
jgi:ribosomal protein S18 acetylase RimI-like enzyme